jgi:hypothetical protein
MAGSDSLCGIRVTGWEAMKLWTARFAAIAATLGVVLIAASGCASASPLQPSTAAPRVGDCWTTTFAAVQKTEDWEGDPAIPCTESHENYTYALTKLAPKFTYSSWLTSGGTIRTDVDRAAYTACLAEQNKNLPGLTTREALLYPTYFLPSVDDWAAGARWVRCDISLIKVGSTIAAPELARLPAFATLKSTLASHPETYALCENDPASNGPDGPQTTYATCTGASDWTFVGSLTMAGTDGATYPGLAALAAIGKTQCATLNPPASHEVFAEPPAKVDWTKYNDRQLDCWSNNN